jgi:predicted Zn finger-like uncharacterized protein
LREDDRDASIVTIFRGNPGRIQESLGIDAARSRVRRGHRQIIGLHMCDDGSFMSALKSPFAEPQLPTVCPSCQSSAIATTSKIADAESYWRCRNCGDVWNPTRSDARPGGRPYRTRYRAGG